MAQERYGWQFDAECGVSYLPLSHVAAQLTDIYLAIFGGGTVWFADKTALQGSLVDTLREVNPTIFIGMLISCITISWIIIVRKCLDCLVILFQKL